METVRQEYRPLTTLERMQVDEVKAKGQLLLDALNSYKPGREISLAKTKVEEAVMWAVKGITG